MSKGSTSRLPPCLDMTDYATARYSLVQTDVQQAFLQYKYQAQAAEGVICICPIVERDLPATTELLTQSFSESMGYFSVYRCACVSLAQPPRWQTLRGTAIHLNATACRSKKHAERACRLVMA